MRTILLVEDDPEIRSLITLHLNSSEYGLTACATAQEALACIGTQHFNLVILDIKLPDGDGRQLCKHIRSRDETTPILMLTCQADEADKVLALELGADDYVTKPFGVLELMARIKAILRRSENRGKGEAQEHNEILYKGLCIDIVKRKVTLDGNRLDLTTKEFDLLRLLAGHPGQPFSRKELLQQVWGVAFSGYEHTITSHINRLRLKLEKDLTHPQFILTAWGTGYRFAE